MSKNLKIDDVTIRQYNTNWELYQMGEMSEQAWRDYAFELGMMIIEKNMDIFIHMKMTDQV